MGYMDTLSKYNVGQLNECIIDEKINNGMNILIPINMKLFGTIKFNFYDSFDLTTPLYFLVKFGNDEFIKEAKISIVEYADSKVFKSIDFPYDDKRKIWILTIALEGMMYILNKDIEYIPFHNMR